LTHIIDYQQSHNMSINETWIDMAANVNIPVADSGIVKEYRGMPNNVTVKQADVLLMMHPLLPKLSLKDQRASTSYYLGKQSPDGPAMTFAIAAVVENQIAQSGVAAFTYELAAQEP
jgi:trehalose/maltose hydrolase-like predicted phosphorylase